MNMPVLKIEPNNVVVPPAPAAVIPLKLSQSSFFRAKLLPTLSAMAVRLVPPLVTVGIPLAVWQILCDRPGATLPAPTKIWAEAHELITDPFFVAGPQDIGLGWRVLTSLQRVAVGYGLAGIIGIALGTIIGQSVWAMRGLDPIFQVLRTISPLAKPTIHSARIIVRQQIAIFCKWKCEF